MHSLARFMVLAALTGAALAPLPARAATQGLVIKQGGVPRVTVWNGVVDGEIEVHHGETTAGLEVFWLDQDSVEFQPAVPPHGMAGAIADPAIATFSATGDWTFQLAAGDLGMTELTLELRQSGSPIYASPPIEVHVAEEHQEAEGLVLRIAGSVIVTVWRGQVSGQIAVPPGGTAGPIDVSFLDPDSAEFVPDDPDFFLELDDGNPAVAQSRELGGWTFEVDGVDPGLSSLVVHLFHVDHPDFSSPEIPVHVTASAGAPRTASGPALRLLGTNPTRAAARFALRLPRAAGVRLAVHDVGGREVERILEGPLPAGEHLARWEGSGAPPGLYFVTLVTPEARHVVRVTRLH